MTKIIKKVTLNAPASTSTGVDPTKGTQENPYTKEEYEELCRLGLWTHGWFVEGIGIIYPDVVITSSYPYYPIEDEDDDWNNDDDWYDDGTNPHPNPSPDETGGNGGNYPPDGGGGGGGNGTGGGNGNNGGGNGPTEESDEEWDSHHHNFEILKGTIDSYDMGLKVVITPNNLDYDVFIFNGQWVIFNGHLNKPIRTLGTYIDHSHNSTDCHATSFEIHDGTWELYKKLVRLYKNAEWAAYFFVDISMIDYNEDGFPNGESLNSSFPKDSTKCIISTINNVSACVVDYYNGVNCFVHSHPHNNNPDKLDRHEASIAFYENGNYKLFAIVFANSSSENLDFKYYFPFNKYENEEWERHPVYNE